MACERRGHKRVFNGRKQIVYPVNIIITVNIVNILHNVNMINTCYYVNTINIK